MRLYLTILLTLTFAFVAHAAAASVVQFEEQKRYTRVGQSLNFTFVGLPPAEEGSAFLFIRTAPPLKGNDGIDVGTSRLEYFDLSVSGVNVGRYGCGTDPDLITIPNASASITDCEFAFGLGFRRLGLSEASSFVGGMAEIILDFSDEVGAADDGDAIVVSLTYREMAAVPLPAGGAALLGSLVALGFWRRRV